jgi:hypothetical protein
MTPLHLAQVNIGRVRAPVDDPLMAGFTSKLDEINALAERSPGFVWRLQTDAGNATEYRPYDDDRLLINMSVWTTIEDLQQYVYRTLHADFLRQRYNWFEKFSGVYMALWWVPAGHRPGLEEAVQRLAHLEAHGPAPFAFTFQKRFPADEEFVRSIDWSSFESSPAD